MTKFIISIRNKRHYAVSEDKAFDLFKEANAIFEGEVSLSVGNVSNLTEVYGIHSLCETVSADIQADQDRAWEEQWE